MLLTALPPAPPTPQTMIRGFNSLSSGAFRLIDMAFLIGWTPAGADWNACFPFTHALASGERLITRLKNSP